MKVKKFENLWYKISSASCKQSSLNAPSTETPVSHPLSGVIDNWTPQYESQEVGKFMQQKQVNRLQMVQFECPK